MTGNPFWRVTCLEDLPPPETMILGGKLYPDGEWRWWLVGSHSKYWWEQRYNWEGRIPYWSDIPAWITRGPVEEEMRQAVAALMRITHV